MTAGASAWRSNAAERAFPPVGDFVAVDGAQVHYVQQGSGPHVVFLHSAGGNLRDFTFELMGRLSDRYTVTAFDRPGFGYSQRIPSVPQGAFDTVGESPMQQADLLRKASAQLGITDPIIVGHSFGAIVGMAWAVDSLARDDVTNPAALVSFSGVLMPWPGELDRYYVINGSVAGGAVLIPLISAFVPPGVVTNAVEATFAPRQAPDGFHDHFGGPLAVRQTTFRANARQVNSLRPHIVEMTAHYPRLTLPIEVLHGAADVTVPMEVHPLELVKLVPSMNLTPLEGAGHQPHHADPQAAVDAIDRAAARAGLR